MLLKSCQIIKGVGSIERTGVNETHKQITDVSPVFGLIKQRVLAMKNRLFENLFADIVIQGCPWNSEKEGERFPMLKHIGNGLSHRGIGLDLPLVKLFV